MIHEKRPSLKDYLCFIPRKKRTATKSSILQISAPRLITRHVVHAITPRSPALLSYLPTEIVDQIVSFLDDIEDVLALRAVARVFAPSAKARIFSSVRLSDFRRGEDGLCGVEQLLELLESDAGLRAYVQRVELGSVLDPTVWKDVEALVPKVLGMLEVKEIVVSFREVLHGTKDTHRKGIEILADILKKFNPLELTVEFDFPNESILECLHLLPMTSLVTRGSDIPLNFYYDWYGLDLFMTMSLPHLFSIDLGEMAIWPRGLRAICQGVPSLTSLSITVARHVPGHEVLSPLSLRSETLRNLSVKLTTGCNQEHHTAGADTSSSPIYLSEFKALHTLSIDASFFFEPQPHPANVFVALAGDYYRELPAFADLASLLPPNLQNLIVFFNFPHAIYQRGCVVYATGFEWVVDLVLEQRYSLLRRVVLQQVIHFCEGISREQSMKVSANTKWEREFEMGPEISSSLRERGVDVSVLKHEGDLNVGKRRRFSEAFLQSVWS